MKKALAAQLAALPALKPVTRPASVCKICGGDAGFFDVVDFNKFCSSNNSYEFGPAGVPVEYLRCNVCEFLFTSFFDDWTTEEFGQFIYNADYIKVDGEYAGDRAARQADELAPRLGALHQPRILDYGSGEGLFAQHLRARGFSRVENYDPFSSPVRPTGTFDVITCFEVLEHTTQPLQTIADIASLLDPGGCVLFSTGLQPANIAEVRANWWYVGPRNGHCSIYGARSLAAAGQAAGLILRQDMDGFAFSGRGTSRISKALLGDARARYLFRLAAPGRGGIVPPGQEASWQDAEGEGREMFRWTKRPEIGWTVQREMLQPADITVVVPFCSEIKKGFAGSCAVRIGPRSAPLIRGAGVLVAEMAIDRAYDPVITLVTPQPLRPCDLRPVDDDRLLGVAVGV